MTIHSAKNILVTMLERNIHIFYNLIFTCNCVNKLVCNSVGIAVENPYPFKAVNPTKSSEKLCKHRFAVFILTETGCVLSNDIEFLDSTLSKTFRLFYNIFNISAAESSSNHRDCTVGTTVVTTLGNFEISGVGGS